MTLRVLNAFGGLQKTFFSKNYVHPASRNPQCELRDLEVYNLSSFSSRNPSSIYINNFFSFATSESGKRKCKSTINLSIYLSAFGNPEILIRIYTKYQIPKSKEYIPKVEFPYSEKVN